VTWYNDGNYSVGEWKSPEADEADDCEDEAAPPPFVSFSCFYSVWQRDYGHIKVSKPSEDICNKCVAFSNRHKFKDVKDATANSSADKHLFADDEPPPLSYYDDKDSNEEEEDANDGGEPEEEHSAAQTTTQEKSPIKELLENSDAVADDPELEAREQMIGRAYMHVEMARVQRLMYVEAINKARHDATENVVHHSNRTYTFLLTMDRIWRSHA
jgi:hypothetical protein